MGKADTKSHRRRTHTSTKRHHKSSEISKRNMRLVEEMFSRDAAASASAAPQKAMSASKIAKMLRRQKTFKVKNFGKRALSMVAENGDPVKQVKDLGELVKKHSDYLFRKRNAVVANNSKALIVNAQATYDIAVSLIQEYLDITIRTFGAQYVAAHGFADIPTYEKGDDHYEDVENLTEFLSEFKETIQRRAPEMMPQYTVMMRQVVTEIMKMINTSLEKVGEKKANNVNALANLFSGL